MEENTRKNLLYGVITLLLLALVIETGFLVSNAVTKSHGKKDRVTSIGYHPYRAMRVPNAVNYNPQPKPYQSLPSRGLGNDWDPFEEMRDMQEQMNRIFNESFGRALTGSMAQGPASAFQDSSDFDVFTPAIDLQEADNAYIAKADLPGLEKDKIDVNVTGNVLTLSGERRIETQREDAQKGFYASERSYGSFSRSVPLPGPVDESNITADYKNGVLTVTLPKVKEAEAQGKKVAVN